MDNILYQLKNLYEKYDIETQQKTIQKINDLCDEFKNINVLKIKTNELKSELLKHQKLKSLSDVSSIINYNHDESTEDLNITYLIDQTKINIYNITHTYHITIKIIINDIDIYELYYNDYFQPWFETKVIFENCNLNNLAQSMNISSDVIILLFDSLLKIYYDLI